jgi:hypothetical protein
MGEDNSRRALLQAIAGQQKTIQQLMEYNASLAHEVEVLKLQMTHVGKVSGLDTRINAIRAKADSIRAEALKKQADVNNPAQPVPDPPSQPATETTEQAVTPETMDDPRRPGQTPGSVQDIAADTTDLAMNPGESLPTSPYGDMVDVTAPVAGTETHVPDEQTRIETDVRVGDPMRPDTAFPWITGPNQSNGQAPASGEMAARASREPAADGNRTMASLQLAELWRAQGFDNDPLVAVTGKIEASSMSLSDIQQEIKTLSRVQAVAAQRPPANLVPRAASKARSAPSLAGPMAATASASDGAEDIFL